ncbi:MAG: PKD domain-containing protein [Saprospiraceae bacterium]
MKYIYLCVFFVLFGFQQAKAVLPNGSVATDWTLTDLDGNTHNLYSILNSGKHVIIDFSATWCGPCWNYHNTHTLATLWNLYGPNGTDEIMVFFIEGDVTTSTPCLYGLPSCVGGTTGNWVSGTPYPIIDLQTSTVRNNYQITYWPTLYAIRAQDKRVFEVGQRSVAQWESWLFNSFAMDYTSAITHNTCRGNGSIALNVTDGNGGIYYEWSNGGGNQATISNLQAGTYSCRISDTNGYFINSSNFVVNGVPDLQTSLVEQINVSCFGEQDGILEVVGGGGGGGYTYNWSNGGSGARVENLAPGSYSVTVNDSYNCDVTQNYTVTQPVALFGTSYPYDALCDGQGGYVECVGLFGTAPYLYDMGGIPQADPYFYNLQPGDYDYVVTDANGCTYIGIFEIEQVPGPVAMAAHQGNISCAALQTTVSGVGSATGGNITYLWTTTDGNIVSGGNTINAIVDAGGTYTLKVTNINNDCFSEASTTVESTTALPTAAIADANPLTCVRTQATLDGTQSSQGSNFSYLWTTQNGNIVSGETSLTPIVDEPGDYLLQVTNNINGCIKTTSKALDENIAQPALSVTDGELTCSITSVELCGTTDGGLDIVWQIGQNQVTATCVTVTEAGTYHASVTGTNGCVVTRSATVNESSDLPQVAILAPDEVNCVTREINIQATLVGDESDFSISWTTLNGNIVSGENTLTPTVDKGGTYALNVINIENGCTSNRSVTVMEDTDLPSTSFTFVQNGLDLELTSVIIGTFTSLEWDLGNGMTSNDPNVSIQFPETGTYTICLTATNDCGVDELCIDVLYVSKMGFQIAATNVTCFDANDGTISVTPVGGLPNYEITWEGPNGFLGNQLELTGLAAGIYTAILTDAQGSTIEISQEITQPTSISQVSVEIVNDVNSSHKGSVTPIIDGGSGRYTYLWSNGSTNDKLQDVGAGSYTVEVTDEFGCTKTFGPYVVENSTNVNDINFLNDFRILPNPASDKVIIAISFVKPVEKSTLSIFNTVGQLVASFETSGDIQKTIDISGFKNGMYTVEIRDGKSASTRKLIVIQ